MHPDGGAKDAQGREKNASVPVDNAHLKWLHSCSPSPLLSVAASTQPFMAVVLPSATWVSPTLAKLGLASMIRVGYHLWLR